MIKRYPITSGLVVQQTNDTVISIVGLFVNHADVAQATFSGLIFTSIHRAQLGKSAQEFLQPETESLNPHQNQLSPCRGKHYENFKSSL